MLHLIPKPLYRLALRIAYVLRHYWRRITGATGTGVSVIARDLDGQVLLVRHSYGPVGWYFPGGGVGRNEAPETAARRELLEETGCAIEAIRKIGVIEEQLSGVPHTAHIFEGIVDAMPKADGREVVEARFFPLHSLPEPLSPRTKARLSLWHTDRG
ncbi:MAG: NUDIX domain-containing protein [Erythrobacter sp.]